MKITDYLIRRATRAFVWRAVAVIAAATWSVLAYLIATI